MDNLENARGAAVRAETGDWLRLLVPGIGVGDCVLPGPIDGVGESLPKLDGGNCLAGLGGVLNPAPGRAPAGLAGRRGMFPDSAPSLA